MYCLEKESEGKGEHEKGQTENHSQNQCPAVFTVCEHTGSQVHRVWWQTMEVLDQQAELCNKYSG